MSSDKTGALHGNKNKASVCPSLAGLNWTSSHSHRYFQVYFQSSRALYCTRHIFKANLSSGTSTEFWWLLWVEWKAVGGCAVSPHHVLRQPPSYMGSWGISLPSLFLSSHVSPAVSGHNILSPVTEVFNHCCWLLLSSQAHTGLYPARGEHTAWHDTT